MRLPPQRRKPSRSRDGRVPRPLTGPLLRGVWRALSATIASGARLFSQGLRGSRQADWRERLALDQALHALPERALWWHAASLGEVRAVLPLAAALYDLTGPSAAIVTTSTSTGRALAERSWPVARAASIRLAPFDSHGPLRRFLSATNPCAHVIVETELWPQRLALLAQRRVPVVIASGRISTRRWPTYRRLGALYSPVIGSLAMVCPASNADAERFVQLGLDRARLGPIGSLKWEAAPAPPSREEAEALAGQCGIDRARPWIVFGSAHPGEVLPVLRALAAGRLGGPLPCGVLLAPRHLDRYAAELEALERTGWRVHRASLGAAPSGTDLLVLDGLGLLPRIYPLAAAAVLGGSFVPVGGHTPLEAAAAGCPLVAGPYRDQQTELCEALRTVGALVAVEHTDDAARQLRGWLDDPTAAAAAGRAGQAALRAHQGIAARIAAAIAPLWR